MRRDTGDKDDCASSRLRCWLVAVGGSVPSDHAVCTSLSHEEGTGKVDGERALDILIGRLEEGLVRDHARGIDIDIDSSKLRFDLLNCGSDLGTRGDVRAVILQFDVMVVSQSEKTGGRLLEDV